MNLHTLLILAFGLALLVLFAARLVSRRGQRGPDAAQVSALQFASARELLKWMRDERIGYIAVEGGGRWEAKDLQQQGIVNLLREKYFELHNAEQKKYFSELSVDYVAQARELMTRRPAANLRGYRQQLMKLLLYVKDPGCLQEIRGELAAIQPSVEDEQVRSALDNPPAEIDHGHLALLENYLEAHPRFTLARELEAEIARVKKLLGGQTSV